MTKPLSTTPPPLPADADAIPKKERARRRTLVDYQAAVGPAEVPSATPASQSAINTNPLSDQPGALRNKDSEA